MVIMRSTWIFQEEMIFPLKKNFIPNTDRATIASRLMTVKTIWELSTKP